jgi:hypothetical protein
MPRLGVPVPTTTDSAVRVLRTQLARNLILRESSLRKNLYDELDPPAAVDAFPTKNNRPDSTFPRID